MTQAPDAASPAAGPGGSAAAVRVFEAVEATLSAQAAELSRLDGVAGDGDHGLVMVRGARAALAAARAAGEAGADLPTTVRLAGQAWAADAGGTSGVLWGAGLVAFGQRLSADARPTSLDLAAATRAFLDRVVQLGRANRGDKTMIDTLAPFADALDQAAATAQPDGMAQPVGAPRSGGVVPSGDVVQSGGRVRSGGVVPSGDVARSGGRARSGDAAWSGDLARSGDVAWSGGVVPSGDVARSGGRTRPGDGAQPGDAVGTAWMQAVPVAQAAAAATADLVAKVGRGRVLSERGRGTPDAGAISMTLVIQAVSDALNA